VAAAEDGFGQRHLHAGRRVAEASSPVQLRGGAEQLGGVGVPAGGGLLLGDGGGDGDRLDHLVGAAGQGEEVAGQPEAVGGCRGGPGAEHLDGTSREVVPAIAVLQGIGDDGVVDGDEVWRVVADEAGQLELDDGGGHIGGVEVVAGGEAQVGEGGPPDHGGGGADPPGRRPERADRRRGEAAGQGGGIGVGGEVVAERLLEGAGVAGGELHHQREVGGGQPTHPAEVEEGLHLVGVEPAELEAGGDPGELVELGGRGHVGVGAPQRDQHDEGERAHLAGDEAAQVDERGVGEVQVVDDEERRLRGGGGPHGGEGGHQAGRRGLGVGTDLGGGVGPRPQRRQLGGRPARRPPHRQPVGLRLRRRGLAQRRLAGPLPAPHHQHRPVPGAGARRREGDRRELARPTDQLTRDGHHHCHGGTVRPVPPAWHGTAHRGTPPRCGASLVPPLAPGDRPMTGSHSARPARPEELARLERAAVAAAAGRAAVVGIDGTVGMGKTVLLDHLRAHATEQGFAVLATQGRAADVELGFSSLLTMLQPLDDELDELAGDLAPELRSALALGRQQADAVAVRLATFRVLARVAARRPLVLAIDDAHLLDRATADVLAFAVGRFCADAVLTVATSEPDEPTALDDLVTETITLEALGPAALGAIVRATVPMADDPLRRCIELAEGNPLTAVELAASLTPVQRSGDEALPMLPRPTGVLARAFARRLAPLSPAARNALAVLAADDTADGTVLDHALDRLGEPTTGLAEAEAAGLVQCDGHAWRFTHPLLRPVAYHLVGTASRRAAHRALADALSAPHQGASRAWQLAAAAVEPDETAAAALALVAGDAARRGGPASAARTVEWAASLTPEPVARRERLVLAARWWLEAGDADAAGRVADLLAAEPATPDGAAVVTGVLRAARGPTAALAAGHAAVVAVPDADRERARLILAEELLESGAVDEAVLAVTGLAPSRDGVVAGGARAVLALAGAGTSGAVPDDDGSVAAERARALAAAAAVEAGRPDEVLRAVPHPSLAAGGGRAHAGIQRARAMAARGDVVLAHEELQRLDALVPDRAGLLRAPLDLALAEVELLVGRHDDARERATAVREQAQRLALTGLQDRATWILGRLCLAGGDHRSAYDLLQRCWRRAAHTRVADLAAAARPIRRPEELHVAAAAARPSVGHADPAVDVRARRALLSAGAAEGDPADVVDAALAVADAAGLPLEAAEVLLAAAEAAVAGRDDEAAKRYARMASDRLAAIGVVGWKARLEPLLQAVAAPTVAAKLSPAEHRVALAVAEGRTNQESAEVLFLSTKTVDFHLQSIYRKLGIRSRTELAVLVHRDHAGAPQPFEATALVGASA
jgi:DNA-binding NarL/FixJ family response regulator